MVSMISLKPHQQGNRKALDIRPPVLTISQLAGSRTEDSAQASRLLLENTPENSALLKLR